MDEDFKEFINKLTEKLEKKRKKLNFWNFFYKYIIRPITFILGLATIVFFFMGFALPPFFLWALLCLVVWIVSNSYIKNPVELYTKKIKEEVIPEFFKRVKPNLNYKPYEYDEKTIIESGIFSRSFFNNSIRKGGEDLVFGKIKNIEVRFNEIWFIKEQVNFIKTLGSFLLTLILIPFAIILAVIEFFDGDNDMGGSDNSGSFIPFFEVIRDEVIYYKGLFMYADFNKDFNDQIIILPKRIENIQEKLSDKLLGNKLSEIKVESELINKYYKIYCSDKQTGFYVLSPKIIEALTEIIHTEKVIPILTFKNGKMYMTIPWEKDYFSVDLKEKITGPEYFTKYLNEIESFQKIIEHFNLENRIWTKQ